MRKLTKVCLIVAFVMFVASVGCFIGAGAMKSDLVTLAENWSRWGIEWNKDFLGVDKDGNYDLEEYEMIGEFDADDVDSIQLDVDAGSVAVKTINAQECRIWALWGDSVDLLTADVEDGTLYVRERQKQDINIRIIDWLDMKGGDFPNISACNIVMEIPKKQWERFESSMKFGALNVDDLHADNVSIDMDAGSICTQGKLEADDVQIHADMGSIQVEDVECLKWKLRLELGDARVEEVKADEMDVDLQLGNMKLSAVCAGKTNANCQLGNLTVQFMGNPDDYDIDADVELGDLDLHGGGENQRADYDAKLRCELGNIDVTFLEIE